MAFFSGAPLRDTSGRVIGAIEAAQDITEGKRAEQAFRESEHKYAQLVEEAPDAIISLDGIGRLLSLNRKAERISGLSEEEVVGKEFAEIGILAEESIPVGLKEFECVVKGVEREPFDLTIRRKDNSQAFMEANARLITQKGQKPWVQVIFRDITERKRAERELEIRTEILQVVVTGAEEEMYSAVLKVVLHALESEFGVFGYLDEKGDLLCPSMIGHVWDQCLMPEKDMVLPKEMWGESIWGNSLRTGQSDYSNRPFKVPQGHVAIKNCLAAPLVLRGKPIGLMMVANKPDGFNDSHTRLLEAIANTVAPVVEATLERKMAEEEREKLSAQLRQAQKMEAIGTLAGGIAHDFNNILAALLGYTELSLEETEEGSSLQENLEEIFAAGNRAKKLVRQILAFSREAEQETRPVKVGIIIKEVLKLLRASLAATIEIRQDISSDAALLADATNIHQVLLTRRLITRL